MSSRKYKRKAPRSLRTILIIWFLLFSVVPLAFVTGYSVIKYEKAIDNELLQRLGGNAREIGVILSDFRTSLVDKRDRYVRDPSLIYHLSTNDTLSILGLARGWLRTDIAASMTFFNRNGKLLGSAYKDENGEIRQVQATASGSLFLSDQNLEQIKDVNEYFFIEYGTNQKLSLILLSKVAGAGNRLVGYIEQDIEIDEAFLAKLQQRMKLELVLIRIGGQVVVATHPDFYLYKKDFFKPYIQPDSNVFFEFPVRSVPYGFMMYPMSWGQSEFFLALGASKGEAKAVLKNVNYAFVYVVGAVIALLVLTIVVASNTILKPLNELVNAIDDIQSSDRLVEIPIKSDTEIGLLTESFNELSRNMIRARADVKKKIAELETANQELRDAQAKLVHSSKMVSLGQLVAGVAHELNNPIGFIYSNMSHLKEYSERLLKLADVAESHPDQISQAKKELDIDYVRTDLPKLVASCEDGARRTRDIVLGLRNFSRLEEAKLKEIDIHESIDNTLSLLSGEIKNRVQIHKKYGQVPKITCLASQINQVFMNILSNALQAIESSGNVWITTKPTKLNDRPAVSISFQDSGKGMSQQVMDKVFDPFFSTKGVGQGTGLGMSISYGIIQSHGGDIQVKSQVGIGTEFIVVIPVDAQIDESSKGHFADG